MSNTKEFNSKNNVNQVNPDVVPDDQIGEDVLNDIQVTDIAGADELRNMFTQNGYTIVMANQMEIRAFYGDSNLNIGIFLTFDNGDDFNSVDVYINVDGRGKRKDQLVNYLQDKGFDEEGWREYNDLKFNLGELNNIIKLYKNVITQFNAKADEFEELKKAEKKAEKASQPKKPKKEPKPQEEKNVENDSERDMYMGASVAQLKSELRDLGIEKPKGTKASLIDQIIKLKANKPVTHYGTNINLTIKPQGDVATIVATIVAKNNTALIEKFLQDQHFSKIDDNFEKMQKIANDIDVDTLCTQILLQLEGQLEAVIKDDNINKGDATKGTVKAKEPTPKVQKDSKESPKVGVTKSNDKGVEKTPEPGPKPQEDSKDSKVLADELKAKKVVELKQMLKDLGVSSPKGVKASLISQIIDIKVGYANKTDAFKGLDLRSNVSKDVEDIKGTKGTEKVEEPAPSVQKHSQEAPKEQVTQSQDKGVEKTPEPAQKPSDENNDSNVLADELKAKKVVELKQMLKDLGVSSPKGVKASLVQQILDIKGGFQKQQQVFKDVDIKSSVLKELTKEDVKGTKGTEKTPEPAPQPQDEKPQPQPKVDNTPKFAMVSDASQKAQLKKLQTIAKKWEDDINADSDINLFFLEEPKEFKKYNLPTVALGFVCYDLKISKQELNQDPVFKRFKNARGTVTLGGWFTTVAPDGRKCKMCLFLDKDFEKASDDNRKAVGKLSRKHKLMESIGTTIEFKGISYLLESVGNTYAKFSREGKTYLVPLSELED